jgi:hypothetical protein
MIGFLHAAIAEVESGEIATLFLLLRRFDNAWSQRIAGGVDGFQLIGQLEVLKASAMQQMFGLPTGGKE